MDLLARSSAYPSDSSEHSTRFRIDRNLRVIAVHEQRTAISTNKERCSACRLDILVEVKHVVGVVFGFDLGESLVGLLTIGFTDPSSAVVDVKEVHVDTLSIGFEGIEESTGPRDLRLGEFFVGTPHAVDVDVV